jgi:hypothetical protein
MAKTHEDLEGYLNRLERRYERLEDGTILAALASGQPPVAMRLAPPVLVMQVRIGDVPPGDVGAQVRVFRRLLELNVSSLVHAAYGLEGDSILLSAALELDNLDLNELEATLADLGMALSEHVPALREMVQKKS